MKRFLLSTAFIVVVVLAADAQLIKALDKSHPVISADWGDRATSYADGYKDMIHVELKKSFSKALADSIMKNTCPNSCPLNWDYAKYADITCYYVGSYNNMFGGSFHGVEAVIWIPYNENKLLWDHGYQLRPFDFFVFLGKEFVKFK